MKPIEGWEDFRDTAPAVDAMKKPQSGHVANCFGFHIDDYGLPVPFASMPTDEYLAQWRTEQNVPDFQPVIASDVTPGSFSISDLILSVHGVTVVDFKAGGTSRGLFRVTKNFIYGSAHKGFGAQWRNDSWTLGDMGGTARIFKWYLRDIASIEVHRTYKKFRLRDEEVIIRGLVPGPDAKGVKAGVSVNDWLKGAQPEEVTEVQSSSMRFGKLNAKDASTPSDGSPFLGFVEHLAKLVASTKDADARWDVKPSGKDRSHVVTFA